MFLIPEDILDNLICDVCQKYLSVSPVKVYPNKQILCGRCCKDSDGGVVSLYDNIIKRGLFRCINRYDGCNQALFYSETAVHEVNCISKLYICPICEMRVCSTYEYYMSSLALINHFRKEHRKNVLQRSNFSINTKIYNDPLGKCLLFAQGNFLFIIYVHITHDKILLNTTHIGNEIVSREIKQKFTLSSSDGTLKGYITETQPCCKYDEDRYVSGDGGFTVNVPLKNCIVYVDFDLDTRKVQELILLPVLDTSNAAAEAAMQQEINNTVVDEHKLYLSDKFKQKWFPQYILDVSGYSILNVNNKKIKSCSVCHNKFHYFSSNQSIYKCTGCNFNCDTFICSKCYFFGIKKCGEKIYEFAPEETTVVKDIRYYCRWNCGDQYHSWELKDHEYNCDYQVSRICPVENCKWTGILSDLEEHVNSHEGTIFYEKHSFPLRLVKTTGFALKNQLILPVLNDFVSVKWSKVADYYIFSLSIKDCKNKFLTAIVSNNGKIDTFNNCFSLDVEGAPLLLVILRNL